MSKKGRRVYYVHACIEFVGSHGAHKEGPNSLKTPAGDTEMGDNERQVAETPARPARSDEFARAYQRLEEEEQNWFDQVADCRDAEADRLARLGFS